MKIIEKIKGTSNTASSTTRSAFNYQPIINAHPQVLDSTMGKGIFSEIPHEVFELLYVADGKFKNYSPTAPQAVNRSFEILNGASIFLTCSEDEPSAIYTSLPISQNPGAEKPPYFPRYSNLSEGQRRAYLNFLANPLSGKHDVGYVFLFYYGLERQLLTGKTEKAFEMVMKLRKSYPNKSFLRYSANALWGISVLKEQSELAIKFVSEIEDYTQLVDYRLFALLKYRLHIPIWAYEIIAYAKDIGFPNMPYIKKHKEDFIREIETLLINKYGEKYLIFDTEAAESTNRIM